MSSSESPTVWAQLDEHNRVIRVEPGAEKYRDSADDLEILIASYGPNWVKASPDGSIGVNPVALGYTYNKELSAFIPPQPFASWVLNKETCQWQAPKELPVDGEYTWSEQARDWIKSVIVATEQD